MKEIVSLEQYECFKWKIMCIANITKVLNERECLLEKYLSISYHMFDKYAHCF